MDLALNTRSTQFVELINTLVINELEGYSGHYDECKFAGYTDATTDLLNFDDAQFKFEDPEGLEEEEIATFNDATLSRLKESLLSSSFQKALLSTIESVVDDENNMSMKKISLTLDYLMWIALKVDKTAKLTYYYCLEAVLNQLFSFSTDQVESLWTFVEARLPTIQTQLFENTFAERIAVLLLGNSLTDKYNTLITGLQTNSTLKDTPNDRFQSRVRLFMTQLLAIDDNTGLNKYFHIRNSVPPHIETKDVFLSDVLQIQKIFNNPLFYLKKNNTVELNKMTEKIYRVYGQLVEEELRFREKHPFPEQFLMVKPKSESEREYLRQKYTKRVYTPEPYLESSFQKGSKSNELQNADYKFLYHQLELSKVRVQYLLMIYILSVFYIEMTPNHKTEFIKTIGAPITTKHITEDSPGVSALRKLIDIKNELPTVLKNIDPSLPFLLLHLGIDEKIWWKWLLHGKDEQNKGFFVDKMLLPEILSGQEDAFQKLYPFKNKRSFNTFVTPQVSKKMRTGRGLEQLKQTAQVDIDKAMEELEGVEGKLKEEPTDEWKDIKSSHSWKLLRRKRCN